MPHLTLKSIANNPDIKEGMTQTQIDHAIARHTDSETLFDRPYEDNKRVQVRGPFPVESLSPHQVLLTADDNIDGTVSEEEGSRAQDFATMILENLKRTGAGNLFIVSDKPDIGPFDGKGRLVSQADGRYVVEIKGVDVYDPTTGQILSASTDDIAC